MRLVKIIIPIIGVCIATIISIYVFNRIPHVQDSIAQLFQARIFLKGKLYYPSHPLNQFFDYTNIINNGRWYSQYPPGHPLLLASGLLLNVPFMVNPILAGIAVFLTMMIAKDLFSERTSYLSGIFLILSPAFMFMAGSHMSHVGSMVFLLLFLGAMFKEKSVLAGISLGIALLIRPYTTFLYAIPVLIFLWPKKISRFIISFIPFVIVLLVYNYLTNDSPLTFGYTVYYGIDAEVGTGLGFGKGPGSYHHTLSQGLFDAWDKIKSLSNNLFEWTIPSIIPLLVPALFFKKRYLVFYLIPISLLVGHIFYWYHDLCLGPRFLYESLPAVIILSAVGINIIIEKLKKPIPIFLVIGGLFSWTISVRIPHLITESSPGGALPYGRSFWAVDEYLGRLVENSGIENSIVFVDMEYPKQKIDPYLWFGSAFLHNTPDLDGNIIYAHHLGMKDTLLMKYYPGRNYYLYRGYLRNGKLYKLKR